MSYRDDPTAEPDGARRQEEESVLEAGERKVRQLWGGFVDFALKDNVLEVACGLILASAFTGIVNSFVSDILLPPLSVLLPLDHNMDEKFAVLKPGPNYERARGYNTLAQAQADGAVVMAYGIFVNKLVNFFGMGLSLYALACLYQFFSHDPIIKHTVKCKYCRKHISEKAKRCVNCTSWQDGREDRPG